MHSFSINLSMNKFVRTNSARLAVSRPLRDFSPAALAEIEKRRIEGKDSTWKELLNMDPRDTFLLAFWKRFGKRIFIEMDKESNASPLKDEIFKIETDSSSEAEVPDEGLNDVRNQSKKSMLNKSD